MIRIQSLFPSRALRNPVVRVLLAMLGLALLSVLLVFGVVAGTLMIAVGLLRRALSHKAPAAHSTGNVIDGEYRSEEHTSELQSLMRISYAVFCLKKKNKQHTIKTTEN